MTTPFLRAGTNGGATPLGGALRRVEPPAGAPSPFRELRGFATPGAPGAPGPVLESADARELAMLRADLAGARARAEAEGRSAGAAAATAAAEILTRAAAALDEARATLLRADAVTLVDLALEIAGALAGHALAADRSSLADTVARALAAVDAPAPVVRVNPADVARVAPLCPPAARLEPDPAIGVGEVRVETERAIVDGTAAARLAGMRDALIAALERPEPATAPAAASTATPTAAPEEPHAD